LNKYHLSEESKRVFVDFNKIYRERNRNKDDARYDLEKAYGNTYMYYLIYLSPLALKAGNAKEQ